MEWSNRCIPLPWLLFDADLAWTGARFRGGERIPNAVDRAATLAATVREPGPRSASLQWRYLGPGALIENDSVRSPSSTTLNLRLGYKVTRAVDASLDVFNLLDRKVTTSRTSTNGSCPARPRRWPTGTCTRASRARRG